MVTFCILCLSFLLLKSAFACEYQDWRQLNCSDAIIISVIFTFSNLCKQQIEAVVNVSLCVSSDCKGETKVSVFEGDIRDRELLRRACKGAALVFHTASLIDVIGAVEYSELYGVNVKG